LIIADSLNARNTPDRPNRIHPVPVKVNTGEKSISFTLPAYSAAVVSISR